MYNSISFSGGALKGISYCGVLKCLEEKQVIKNIKHFSGTSIGALFALLIVVGYTSKELEKFSLNFDYNLLEDIDISKVFVRYGISSSRNIDKLIKCFLNRKGLYEKITFGQLYEKTGKKLSICCCKLNDFSPVLFNYETHPNFEVYSACKMSMSIPILFTNNKFNGEYLVDGCFYRNIPIEIHPTQETLGFYLLSPESYTQINSAENYIKQVNRCILKKNQDLEILYLIEKGYDMVLLESDINSLDLLITRENRQSLITMGYNLTNLKISSN